MLDTAMFVIEMAWVGLAIDLLGKGLGEVWDKLEDFRETRRDHWLPEYPTSTEPEVVWSKPIWFHDVPKRRTTDGAFARKAAEFKSLAWTRVKDDSIEPGCKLSPLPITKEWQTSCARFGLQAA